MAKIQWSFWSYLSVKDFMLQDLICVCVCGGGGGGGEGGYTALFSLHHHIAVPKDLSTIY